MKFKKPAFNFSNRGLTQFPDEIFDAPRVYKLNLSNNNIREIPKEIAKLKYLETLDLSGNSIRNLYANFFELPNLKILNLNNNVVVTLPKQIGKLQKLKILLVASNKLSTLPSELAKLQNLEEINVSDSMIHDLPISLEHRMDNVRRLWLGHNPLTFLTSYRIEHGMPRLKAVYCFSNKLNNPLNSSDRGINAGALVRGNCIKQIKIDYELEDTLRASVDSIINTIQNQPKTSANNASTTTIKMVPKIFVSYSHDDKDFLKPLRAHLKVLSFEMEFEVWDDEKIRSSENWKEKIENVLAECTSAVLLVSTDFLASDFIRNNELPALLTAARDKGVDLHSVILKPCRYNMIKSLSAYQAANDPKQPMIDLTEGDRERVWLKLVENIQYFMEQKALPPAALGEAS